VKLDGFRMAAPIERGKAKLLTRTGLDWSAKYPSLLTALSAVRAKTDYLDGELCGVGDDGLPNFADTQAATDGARRAPDLLCLRPFAPRWPRRPACGFSSARRCLSRLWPVFRACISMAMRLATASLSAAMPASSASREFVSKTAAARHTSGNRGLWRKAKCLNRKEFVVIGWTDPEG
jgi:ATP-dependent DNA ligase